MLLRIANVLNEEQVVSLHASLSSDAAPWVDGRVTAGHQGVAVKHNQQLDEASSMARDLRDLIISELERNPLFISAALPGKLYPPMFNRYQEGMSFGTHVDGTVRTIAATGGRLRCDLSATLFLSAPESYEGGELIIESDFGSQSAKLGAGDLLLYASSSRHRVNPVTRGQRLAAVFWIQSLVREDVKRQLLFELDRTIQRLTQLGVEQDCMVRLTSHYHGLLRLWTEV
jgi:PKHD-type hydroxylase